jgi:hypothetical protein
LALSGIIEVFFLPTSGEIKDGGAKWAGIYVGIGVGCLFFGIMQVCFEASIDGFFSTFS